MPLEVGEALNNRYRITGLLGQGGMGAVYRAWDVNLKMAVAVKENADASAEAQRQFEREATLLAHLAHPNLPRVTDHFVLPGRGQYLVMDYVDGEDLGAMLHRQGTVPPAQAVAWVAQVCDALSYLHSQNPPVIHRDIKPANIRIARDGRAMLVDFGISKLYEPGGHTTVGAQAVTPGYSPPEQYGGSTDARSDVYALGATLYHLLTGSPPPESVMRMVGAQLTPPRAINPAVTSDVEQAVLIALTMPTELRFQNARAFWAALTGAPAVAAVAAPAGGAAVVRRSEVPAAEPRPGKTRLWAVVAVIVLLLAMVGGFWLIRDGLLGGGGNEEAVVTTGTSTTEAAPRAAGLAATATGAAGAVAEASPLPAKTAMTGDEATAGEAAAGAPADAGMASPTTAPATATTAPPPTDAPTATPLPTPTPRCPVVEGPFAAEWAAHEERLGCALGQPVSHSGAEERFEFGLMFWRSDAIDLGQALVVFNNGTWRIFSHTPFVEGSPDFKCTDANTPAQCPPTPKRGFGMMWCDIPDIRSGLGNAETCEVAYSGRQQEFERGFVLRAESGTYVFFNDGTWLEQ